MALLVVMSAIAFLLPLVFSGLEMGRFHLRRVQNALLRQEAQRYAESGVALVVALLQRDGVVAGAVDHLGEPWAAELSDADIPAWVQTQARRDRQMAIRVEDSARYLNVNDLVGADGKVDDGLFRVMAQVLRHRGVALSLLESLVDWLDADDSVTGLGGAERAWYRMEGRVYGPENGPMRTLDQLALIRGWTETAVAQVRSVFRSVDPRCRAVGVNINTVSADVLTLLDETLPVGRLVEARQEVPIADLAVLAGAGIVIDPAVLPLLKVKSDCFEARIQVQVGEVRGRLEVWLVRQGDQVDVIRTVWGG